MATTVVNSLEAHAGPSRGGWRLERFSPGLNVVSGDAWDTRAAAGLLQNLLLGWREPSAERGPWCEGHATVRDATGEFQLRRRGDEASQRLTISGVAGDNDPQVVDRWRASAPVEVLAEVFCPAPLSEDRSLVRLLSPRVAKVVRDLLGQAPASAGVLPPHDRRADLMAQRDEISQRMEGLLGQRREQSAALEATLTEIDAKIAQVETEIEDLQRRLATLDAQLQASQSRARYAELSRVAEEAQDRRIADDFDDRKHDLDRQIEHWRQTLADLERREASVRDELAQGHPTDTRPEVTLADQRACVAVASRLVADLESEVARFATTTDARHCVCRDAHPRLNPLVETLGQHVLRLQELVGEQDGALRWQELDDEAERLARSRGELRQQLDRLLQRRETLLRTTRPRAAAKYTGGEDFDRNEAELLRAELGARLNTLQAERQDVRTRRRDLEESRARLLEFAELRDLQRQLDGVQQRIADAGTRPARAEPETRPTIRASAALAKLSDGEFRELHLTAGGRSVVVVGRRGDRVSLEGLTSEQRLLVLWALRLALADVCLASGVRLPLVLDEPFGADASGDGPRLGDRWAANLATLLDDFHESRGQVFVFTRREAALERFRSLGRLVRGFDAGASASVTVPPAPRTAPAKKTIVVERVEPSTLLSIDDPVERFPVPIADRHEVFARSRVRTIDDLVFADPSAIAEELQREDVTAELVSLWQTHLSLVCFVVGVDFQAAKALTRAGIYSPEDLAEADAASLRQQLTAAEANANVEAVDEWIEASIDGLALWAEGGYAKRWRRHSDERGDRIRENARRRSSRGRSRLRVRGADDAARRRERRAERAPQPEQLRFYLELADEIERAPSIGPKRAASLTAIGVATVTDLMEADPSDVAQRLDDDRVDAARIVAWQHQASLVCRVPGLRGHDAQVLVGAGFTTPEEIATMKPSELFEFVDTYCDTPEGQRALRRSKRPDLEEVGEWIAGARQRRVVGAA